MLNPCIFVLGFRCGLAGGGTTLSRDVDGPGSVSKLRARMSGGSGSFLRNMPRPMLVPGVGSRLVTVAEDRCRSRRICSWGWCGGSGGAYEGGGGRIEYEDEGES